MADNLTQGEQEARQNAISNINDTLSDINDAQVQALADIYGFEVENTSGDFISLSNTGANIGGIQGKKGAFLKGKSLAEWAELGDGGKEKWIAKYYKIADRRYDIDEGQIFANTTQQLAAVAQACKEDPPAPGSDRAEQCRIANETLQASVEKVNEAYAIAEGEGVDTSALPIGGQTIIQPILAAKADGQNTDSAIADVNTDTNQDQQDRAERALVIRDAVNCWLLYNMEAFAEWHKNNVSVNEKGDIDSPGFIGVGMDPATHDQRIMLTNEETPGTTLASRFHSRKGSLNFVDIEPHQYADLMPMLRIFKVYLEEDNSRTTVEMDFSNQSSLDGIARQLVSSSPYGIKQSLYTRGSEVGVKSFEWQILGTDPFTATKDVEATLTLTAQNFAALSKVRKGRTNSANPVTSREYDYRYLDLCVIPDCEDDYSPTCFEVRVDVGYATNPDFPNIASQKDILYLTLVDHGFTINDDGTLDLTISYRGRLGGLMKSRKMNILLPAGGTMANEFRFRVEGFGLLSAQECEDKLKNLSNKRRQTERDKTQIKNLEKGLSDFSTKYKQIIHGGILDRLLKAGKLHFYNVPDGELTQFREFISELEKPPKLPKPATYATLQSGIRAASGASFIGAESSFTTFDATTAEEAEDAVEEVITRLNRTNLANPNLVRFFFLGDLLGIVLDHVVGANTIVGDIERRKLLKLINVGTATTSQNVTEVRKDLNKLRIIMGNMDIDSNRSPAAVGVSKVNLAHIPISLDQYSSFFLNSVLAKERTNYPFFDFVDDILSELIMDPATNTCFGGLFNLNFNPRVQKYTVPNVINMEERYSNFITNGAFGSGVSRYKALNFTDVGPNNPLFEYGAESTSIDRLHEYLIISAEATNFDELEGDPVADRSQGIFHLYFGNHRGLVKKITFNRTDQEYLPEARYAEEGNFIFNQLANVYDVNIEMLGNNLFKPGQYVYIDTSLIGAGESWELKQNAKGDVIHRSWANLMGLGGYHLVTEIAHSISNDGFNTSIKARWVSSGQRGEDEPTGLVFDDEESD
jgi:hypothetical protein